MNCVVGELLLSTWIVGLFGLAIVTVITVDISSVPANPLPATVVALNVIGSASVVMFSVLESAPFASAFSPRTLNAKEVLAARPVNVWSFVTLVLPTAPLV